MQRILSFYLTKTFKLIMEFENGDYRLLDMLKFLQNEEGIMKDIINDVDVFMTAKLDDVSGTIRWANDVTSILKFYIKAVFLWMN